MSGTKPDRVLNAISIFRDAGGSLRFSEARQAGIQPRTLREMMGNNLIEKLSRGIYRLSELPPLGNPDLATVAARAPQGVVCLISALAYHEITTQIPHEVHLALKKNSETPRIDSPLVRVYWFSGPAFTEGIEEQSIDEFTVSIYGPEKSIADAFKFRNKLGLDIALEALRLYRERRKIKVDLILEYAKICRVEKVMRPYMEAIL